MVATAYVTESGLKELMPYLRTKGKQVQFLCGVGNMNAQQPPALQMLQELAEKSGTRVSFGIVHSASGIFHPKFYFFDNGRTVDIFIGSHNLTAPAFSQNSECSICLSLPAQHPVVAQCRQIFDQWVSDSRDPKPILVPLMGLAAASKSVLEEQKEVNKVLSNAQPIVFAPTIRLQSMPQDVVAAIVNTGYFCSTEFSTANFYINIPLKFTGTELSAAQEISSPGRKRTTAKPLTDKLLVKSGQQSIRWALLDEKQRVEIQQLANSVTNGSQKYGFSTPWGFYVSATQFPHWLSWVIEADEKTQSFWEKSIEGLVKREAANRKEFKHDFSIRFPRSTPAQVNDAASLIQERLAEMKRTYKHERIFRPKWDMANVAPSSRMHRASLGELLSRSLQEMSEEVWLHDLAEFARTAVEQSRSLAEGLKPGSSKKTCEEKLERVRDHNFYGDSELEKWCYKLEATAKSLPKSSTRLSPAKVKERQIQASTKISQLMEEAHQLTTESEEWRFLAPDKTLEKFVALLSENHKN